MSNSTAGDWVVDPAGSTAGFSGKAWWGLAPVRGTFGSVSGSGTLGDDGTVRGELVIDAAALDTKNDRRDKHLLSDDFFNTEKYPSITVIVTSATLTGSSLECSGTMAAAGVTVPVSFTAQVASAEAGSVVLSAVLTMPRTKFGMTWQPLPGFVADVSQGTVTARFVRP